MIILIIYSKSIGKEKKGNNRMLIVMLLYHSLVKFDIEKKM